MSTASSRLPRRSFSMRAGAGVVSLSALPALLGGCTSKDVEIIVEHLGQLANSINDYRKQEGLAAIPLSDKLTAVALKHVSDLNNNHPEQTCGAGANTHSWSSEGNWQGQYGKGAWKGCCYWEDHSNTSCMWDKPKEIAGYSDIGYEIVHSAPATVSAQGALASWKTSPAHIDVILNKGAWATRQWKALGAVYGGQYACAWFGEKTA